jgi:hypothetical protein
MQEMAREKELTIISIYMKKNVKVNESLSRPEGSCGSGPVVDRIRPLSTDHTGSVSGSYLVK